MLFSLQAASSLRHAWRTAALAGSRPGGRLTFFLVAQKEK
jgi:hypothetical protein